MPAPDLQLDADALEAIVRKALASDTATLRSWCAHPLGYEIIMPMTAGLYRVSGTADCHGSELPWSLILKSIRPFSVAEVGEVAARWGKEPHLFLYWKREPLAYQSGLLDRLPGGLVAPRCFEVQERAEDSIWIWLEELRDIYDGNWPLERYGLAGQHYGAFNGAYLAGKPLPQAEWIHAGVLRTTQETFRERYASVVESASWSIPALAHVIPDPPLDRLRRLYDNAEVLLDALDRLPSTLCHLDSSRSNLFACRNQRGEEQTGVIDWGTLGLGPVGHDIVQLIWGSLSKRQADFAPQLLAQTVIKGYLEGLKAAGWQEDPRKARFGFAAATALQWGLEIPEHLLWYTAREERQARLVERLGIPLTQYLERQVTLMGAVLDIADEAWSLLDLI